MCNEASTGRPTRRVLTALGLITGCTLAFQVVFSRMMATVLSYHFSFLTVSLALLGAGVGALLVYVRPEWFGGPLEGTLSRWSGIYGLLLILVPIALVRLDFTIPQDGVDLRFAGDLALTCLLATSTALASGVVVAAAVRGYAGDFGRVYAWDLVGASLGALLVVPLLRFPAPNLLVWLGVVACGAGALFGSSNRRLRRQNGLLAAGGLAMLAASAATTVLYLPMVGEPPGALAADIWHPLSRVQTVAFPPDATYSVVYYDRVFAPVPHVRDGTLPTWADMRLGPSSIGFALTGPGHTLVIGGGGGRDIYNALTSDQTVDVIELNSAIRDAVDDSLGELSGSPYSRDGVSTTIGDGRSILAQRDTKYDQIHIGFTDTLSANAAQGFALTENNLYTVEAFEEYLDHLKPGGILNVSRLVRLVGDEALRVTVLTLAALERHGVEDPAQNIVVIRGTDAIGFATSPYMTVLARLEPFRDGELERIRRLAAERGDGIAFARGGPYYGPWADLAESASWSDFCHAYMLDVCPPTDEKPFFFNMRRPSHIMDRQTGYHYGVDPYQLLLLTLVILLALSVAGLVLPMRLTRSTERPRMTSRLYFVGIGLGFLLLETVLIQRFVLFLGFPTYALSVVLFALLLFTGLGSAISSKSSPSRARLMTVLGGVAALIAISAVVLEPLLRALLRTPFPVRVASAIVILAPFGLLLGMPMPLGLARFATTYPRSVAYAWGVNGIASVLASVVGVAVAITWGFTVTTLVAAACYVGALASTALGPRVAAPSMRTSAAEPVDHVPARSSSGVAPA